MSAPEVCVNQALANFATSYELLATSKVKFHHFHLVHPLDHPRLRQSIIQHLNKSTHTDDTRLSKIPDGSTPKIHHFHLVHPLHHPRLRQSIVQRINNPGLLLALNTPRWLLRYEPPATGKVKGVKKVNVG